MKKYTTEELKNLNDGEICEVAKEIIDNQQDFSPEEKRIVFTKMQIRIARLEDINEVLETAKTSKHLIYTEQFEALKNAYESCDRKDWVGCRSALEVFFGWKSDQDLWDIDLSSWNYQHILRWFEMLYETDLCNEPDGSPARIFSDMINDQFILRMPQHGKSKLREGLKKFFPEAHSMLENSTVYTEDGQKCLTIAEAAESLGMSEMELTDALTDMDVGKYVVTEDQTHTTN